jgi:hypothetical protein
MILEHILQEYLQHMSTNPKSPFSDANSGEIFTEIWRFGEKFWIFHANFGEFSSSLPSFYRLSGRVPLHP